MPFTTGEENLLRLNQESFDFNIQFEQLFFSIIPSALFIVTSSWRTLYQARKPNVVNAPVFQLIKLVCSFADVDSQRADQLGAGCYHNLCWA